MNIKNIGSKLKRVREKNKISIEKVYRDTKIHPNIISALEEGRQQDLPDTVYVKGFINKYAKYLGLDPAVLVKEYKESDAFKIGFNYVMPGEKRPKANYTKNIIYFKKFLVLAVVILVILTVFWGIKKIVNNINSSGKNKIKSNIVLSPSKITETKAIEKEVMVPKNKKLVLKIEALEDTWVQIKSDGNMIFQKVMLKGQTQELKANNNFTIWVGKGSGINLYLNGVVLDSLKPGVVKDVIIDRSGLHF